MNRHSVAALTLLASFGVQTAASAQSSEHERATELNRQAVALSAEGQYEEALPIIREAYLLEPHPEVLLNLAKILDGAGHLDEAIARYEEYARNPDAVEAEAASGRASALRHRQRESSEAQAATDPPPDADQPPDPVAETPSEARAEEVTSVTSSATDDGSSISPLPWIVAGAGVAAVGVGIGFGVAATDSHQRALDGETREARADALDARDAQALTANVLFGVGAVLVITGVVWGILSLGGDGEQAVVALSIGPGTVLASGRF